MSPSTAGGPPDPVVVCCVKWTPLRPDVDPLDGSVTAGDRRSGVSEADHAALEVALRAADARGLDVVVLCVGPADAEGALRDLLAAGARRAVRVDASGGLDSAVVALALATAVDALHLAPRLVVCGDMSEDRGSGSVPAFLADELGVAQALGLVELDDPGDGAVHAVRRLDGGRRERLLVELPAVVSVEGAVAELRRAPLAGVLAAREVPVEVLAGPGADDATAVRLRPWRPRARVVPAPHGEQALERIVALTGALSDRTPPRTVELAPREAAAAILEQLVAWGYLSSEDAAAAAPEVGVDDATDVVERVGTPPVLG